MIEKIQKKILFSINFLILAFLKNQLISSARILFFTIIDDILKPLIYGILYDASLKHFNHKIVLKCNIILFSKISQYWCFLSVRSVNYSKLSCVECEGEKILLFVIYIILNINIILLKYCSNIT